VCVCIFICILICQVNTSYQERFFVLNHDVLEYYDDCSVYLQSQMERVGSKSKVSKFKGTLSTRDLKVSPGTQNGVNQSRDGYHFTIESKFDAKIIECACTDKETRDKWVQKIREASAAVMQEVAHCLFKRMYFLCALPGTNLAPMQAAQQVAYGLFKSMCSICPQTGTNLAKSNSRLCMCVPSHTHILIHARAHTNTFNTRLSNIKSNLCPVPFLSSTPCACAPSSRDPQDLQQTQDQIEGHDKHEGSVRRMHGSVKCGCIIKVRDGPNGASNRIYIGCRSEKAATDTQTSILKYAISALRNIETIGKTEIADHVIMCMVCFSQNLTMTSDSKCVNTCV